MSLDVYLYGEPEQEDCICSCGHEHVKTVKQAHYEANITHNLGKMASEAGIYQHVWRPDEIGITRAKQLIEPLRNALEAMQADPARFEALNPANGWGSYERFVPWLRNYLDACEDYPEATVDVSR